MDETRNVRLAEVMAITGLKRATIYRAVDFPKPFRIGPRAVAWDHAEIMAWMDRCRAERLAA